MARVAVIRADASPILGGGHIMRCLALADGLAAAGWCCIFWVASGTVEAVPILGRSGHKVCVDAPPGISADLLVIDHYGLDAGFETACRPWARRILVIDDLADRIHDCDLLLDQTLGREEADYRALVPPQCQILLGPGYGLLRPDFRALRPAALERRDGRLARMLVSLGGSDPRDMTNLVLKAVDVAGFGGAVDVVLGSVSPNLATVAARLRDCPRIALHVDTPRMAELMQAADLAIGAAGVTSWERCTLGLPSILVVTAENQRLIAQSLNRAGAALIVGDWISVTLDGLAAAVRELSDPAALRAMAASAAQVCDGAGVSRMVAWVEGVQ